MRYGFVIPGGDVRAFPALAREAEAAGWEAVFLPDCISIDAALDPSAGIGFDPWVALTAIAAATARIRLGTMITPLSRRRPWKVARETATLDILSGGRLILPIGLGALDDQGFAGVGEPTDRATRAQLLDESLAILAGLWSGEPFSYSGRHYHLDTMTFLPTPIQRPRIPIWVVGAWPREKSMARALRWDGLLPNTLGDDGSHQPTTPADLAAMRAYIAEHRTASTPFDIVMEGETPGDDPARAAAIVRPLAAAGATWWLESFWTPRPTREGYADPLDLVRARIAAGPPRID